MAGAHAGIFSTDPARPEGCLAASPEQERGEAAVKEIVASSGNNNIEMVELDLLSLASVRR